MDRRMTGMDQPTIRQLILPVGAVLDVPCAMVSNASLRDGDWIVAGGAVKVMTE
jgi:hypothetical protein